MAIKLNNANLATIRQNGEAAGTEAGPKQSTLTPLYDRSSSSGIKEGIVHIGVGGFHRAHLAVYVDSLMGNPHNVKDWAICGVGLKPWDAPMRDALRSQDCLYTVVERSAEGSSARVVGSINSYLFAPDEGGVEAVIAKMAHPDTKIVSMTITESGYYYNENTHQLEVEDPDIKADVASPDLAAPATTFGYLFAALKRRKDAGLRPFTVVSCDNMHRNGTITRDMLISLAKLRDAEMASWIEEHGAFPNSMVDRITPRTIPADMASLKETFGVEDDWPVVTEPFMQWVVEDQFVDGERPPFEKVGVQVVEKVQQVEEFELWKLRLLNASHTAIAYSGYLAGFEYVHEVFANKLFHSYISKMMHEEVKPLLPRIPGQDVDAYCAQLLHRFSNPTIMDQITRLTLNGTGKLPQFVMPSVAEQIMTGKRDFRRLTFIVASWFRYCTGTDEHGKEYVIDDPMAEDLKRMALEGGTKPYPLLTIQSMFGDNLRGDEAWVKELTEALESIHKDGAMKTLEKYV